MKRSCYISILMVLFSCFLSITVFATSPEEDFVMNGTELELYIGAGGDVVIPSVIDGKTVKTIGELAFWKAPITSVVVPETVTKLEDWAFVDCVDLISVVLLGVEIIGEVAFYYCENLTDVSLPDTLKTIEDEAFAYCSSLVSITLPSSVKTIEYGVFHACTSLESIVIPDSVVTLEKWAFYNCVNLKEVKLSSKMKTLAEGTFANCTSLAELVIPEGVTKVEKMVFFGCYYLKQVFFPSTVTTMGEYMFTDGESIIYPEEGTGMFPVVLWGYEGVVSEYALEHGLLFLSATPSLRDLSYSDVSSSDWYLSGVTFVTGYDLMFPVGEEFLPHEPATRQMTAEVFARLSGEELSGMGCSFQDVTEDYGVFVQWCFEHGVMSGYDAHIFGGEDSLTREQFATIMASYATYLDIFQEGDQAYLEEYFDFFEISPYALSSLAWAVEQGLLRGFEGYLSPSRAVSRGEVATVLLAFYRMIAQDGSEFVDSEELDAFLEEEPSFG